MKKKAAQLLVIATIVAVTPTLQGCTDEEIAATLGGVALAAGIAAIAVGASGHHDDCREVCHDYRDYRGNWQRECHTEGRPRYGRFAAEVADASEPASAESELLTGTNWGSTFDMSFESSSRLINALKQARDQKNLKAVLDLGLSRDDIKKMGQNQMPSDSGIDSLAQNLGQDSISTRKMIESLLAGASFQAPNAR